MEKIRLQVLGLSYNHSNSGAYALVLSEEAGDRRIPIIIGGVEAQAIAIQLEGLTPPRPLTHDLFVSFAEAFNIMVEEIYIYKLKDGVFYSELVCTDGKTRIRIDSRTSDAVALALRFKVPIFTSREIMEKAGIILDIEDEDKQTPTAETSQKSTHTREELNAKLQEAIANEDYELASRIRDELKNLSE